MILTCNGHESNMVRKIITHFNFQISDLSYLMFVISSCLHVWTVQGISWYVLSVSNSPLLLGSLFGMQNLKVYNKCFFHQVGDMASDTMTVAGLGRPFDLGMLYNALTDEPICGKFCLYYKHKWFAFKKRLFKYTRQ